MIVDKEKIDERNYNVSFDKIGKELNYMPSITIEEGVKEIKKSAEEGNFEDYTNPKYSNYKFLQGNIYSDQGNY